MSWPYPDKLAQKQPGRGHFMPNHGEIDPALGTVDVGEQYLPGGRRVFASCTIDGAECPE